MSTGHGQKTTTDAETLQKPKHENPGTVLSDSLGAESIRDGGSFAANSDARGPSDQPAKSTTTNTTDVSNAIRLEPAPDAEARLAQEGWQESDQLAGAGRLGKDSGTSSTYSSTVGSSSAGPKGQDLQEGGFDSSAPNASFSTDIGGKNDPGRAALKKFEEQNVPFSGGAGPRESEITNDGQFDSLGQTNA